MKKNNTKKYILIGVLVLLVIAGSAVIYAYVSTLNKTELEFNIHINEQMVYQSAFGESPTFAIWIEDPSTGDIQTIYVTNRAAHSDWAGKADVPVALPMWFEIDAAQKASANLAQGKSEQLIISGATPKPGYFSTRVRVKPESRWICWIEVNLAGDYNETYKEFDPIAMTSDEYGMGQPALLYKAEITANIGETVVPEIAGMLIIDPEKGTTLKPLEGITTAKDVFDEILIRVVNPKPRIIN
jgi:hypothetical protein